MTTYVGNGAYCYANSTAMLLATIGEQVSPGLIEVLSGVGLGAETPPGSSELWFNNLVAMPDYGISKALDILGFAYTERAHEDGATAPLDELRAALEEGAVVLGPVDMGYLRYVPGHQHAAGADHFVMAYAIDEQHVALHDPAGFPHVALPLADLELAWRAERVPYRRGAYRSWTQPRRTSRPDEGQIYEQALRWFAECYRTTHRSTAEGAYAGFVAGPDAIRQLAASVRGDNVAGPARGHLVNFALPLGAKRALDYAAFFDAHDDELAAIKRRQARLFGKAHTQAAGNEWVELATTLEELAGVEAAFETSLLERVPEPAGEAILV